jgi:hypothetical protein
MIYQEFNYTDSYGRRVICRVPQSEGAETEYIGFGALLIPYRSFDGTHGHKQIPFKFKINEATDVEHAFFRFDVERDAAAKKEQEAYQRSQSKIIVPL